MKKIGKTLANVIILMTLLSGISICQTTENQVEGKKLRTFGVGFDFKPVIANDFFYFYEIPSQFIFSLNVNNVFRIEPKFGFSSSFNTDNDREENISASSIGIGVYGLKYYSQILFIYGFNFNHLSSITERDDWDHSRWERKTNGIGPSFGLEYLLGKHFSFGTEFGVIYSKNKIKDDYDINDGIINNEYEFKEWSTISGLQFRFYF